MVVSHTDLSEVSGGGREEGGSAEMLQGSMGRRAEAERTRDGTCRSWSCGGAVLQQDLVLPDAFCAYPHDRDRCRHTRRETVDERELSSVTGGDELKGQGDARRDVSSVLSSVGESSRHGGS